MKKGVLLVLFVAVLFVGCSGRVPGGDEPRDTEAILREVQTGTQGVGVSLVDNYPPPVIYDENELIAVVEVQNKGNHNLNQQDCFVQITGFDPSIIRGDFATVRSCADTLEILDGKNVYNTKGGMNQLEFSSSNIQLPDNVFEYQPRLNVVTCYNYQTNANPSVCVDPLLYQVTEEQRTCKPQDVSMGGGQGGPVGVSYVGVDMVGNKAIFEVTVQNFGTGRVLNPNADIRSCAQTALEYRDLDKVEYAVQMSAGNLIDCKPRDGVVRLDKNKGKIVCSFEVPNGAAFETPLQVQLSYSYIDSFMKQIKVVDTPH